MRGRLFFIKKGCSCKKKMLPLPTYKDNTRLILNHLSFFCYNSVIKIPLIFWGIFNMIRYNYYNRGSILYNTKSCQQYIQCYYCIQKTKDGCIESYYEKKQLICTNQMKKKQLFIAMSSFSLICAPK